MTVFDVATTKTDLAYRLIRRQILNGELAPAASIDQEVLARSLGLSTTPVREALRRLEAERLVQTRAHRDTIVAPATASDLEEVYLVRISLDPLAASLAAKSATDEERAKLRELAATAPSGGDPIQQLDHNRILHKTVYTASRNSVLIEILERLWDQSDRYRLITIERHAVSELAGREHQEIVDAVCAGNGRLAAKLMRQHVSDSLDRLRRSAAG